MIMTSQILLKNEQVITQIDTLGLLLMTITPNYYSRKYVANDAI
jgi:hypothetical protein